jgi:hypothetical protein
MEALEDLELAFAFDRDVSQGLAVGAVLEALPGGIGQVDRTGGA